MAAHVFTDGHDMLSVWLLSRDPGSQSWLRTPMEALGNDEWEGAFTVSKLGTRLYTVSAQLDRFGSWRRDTLIKISFGQDVRVDLEVGAALFKACAGTFTGDDAERLLEAAEALTACADAASINRLVDDQRLVELLAQWTDEDSMVTYERHLRVSVDPELAAFGAWYEMFPRSAAAEEGRHGSLNDVVGHLDRVARMGFDILYLPPIHPIGASYRKGKNNALTPKATDVGSPWAIGSSAGGHKAIHPQLGTIDDFDRLVKEADRRGLAIALDIAFQCSPDHPYVAERPDWFKRRSDGSIQYAENPPKKYQDIYPFDFECEQWRDLWEELKSVFEHWIGHGVRVFRVDNPHTKSFAFWEWVIRELKDAHPEVVFLAEAFTRPKVMYRLAKLGFSQSYTYFAWRNEKHEIEEYLNELTNTEVAEYFRPNLLAQHSRYIARAPPDRRQTRVHGAVDARRDAKRELWSVWPRFRTDGKGPTGAWERGVPELREVRDQALGLQPAGGQPFGVDCSPQRGAESQPRPPSQCFACLSRNRQSGDCRVQQARLRGFEHSSDSRQFGPPLQSVRLGHP